MRHANSGNVNGRDRMRFAVLLPCALLFGCAVPRTTDCAFAWQPGMRDSLILPAQPHLLGRNWKGDDIWATQREEIARDYALDRPVSVMRLKGGDLELVSTKRVPTDLDGEDLYFDIEPCWMKVYDAALLGTVRSAKRLEGRQ